MEDVQAELAALALHLRGRREAILHAWQLAIQRDPKITTGDHIPSMLATFERALHGPVGDAADAVQEAGQQPAAAHGLQRWRQGYDLREVTRELGKLNECVVAELDAYTAAHDNLSHAAIAAARRVWAAMASTGIEESVGQYFELQKQEAAGHVRDMELALADIRELEQQRGDLWRQAAHDLRGNLGVVANATVALTHGDLRESSRDDFVRILMRNVTSLHHLLDDVTSLARLQAGREQRRIEPLDVAAIMQQLCEGIRPLAQQHRLFLRCDGPPGFAAEGDPVKIRRIAQNLILNAVKFTRQGGITVSWGDSEANDPKRWALSIQDTGPGIHSAAGKPMANALEDQGEVRRKEDSQTADGGEGIGLSIVKRLCDMLDASIELNSVEGVGTTFRILFPRQYS
jgi:signal transduction histidine kinase